MKKLSHKQMKNQPMFYKISLKSNDPSKRVVFVSAAVVNPALPNLICGFKERLAVMKAVYPTAYDWEMVEPETIPRGSRIVVDPVMPWEAKLAPR